MEQAAVAYLSYLSPEGVLWKNGVKKKKPSKHLRLQEYDCQPLFAGKIGFSSCTFLLGHNIFTSHDVP